VTCLAAVHHQHPLPSSWRLSIRSCLIGLASPGLTGCARMTVQEGFVAEDDFGASADYTRENDDEAAAIAERKRWDEKNAALQTAQVFLGCAGADMVRTATLSRV
jgi:hypothetical protein